MSRVAIVTGGTRGIGAAISVGLKEAGHKVAATYAGNDEAAQKFTGETGIPAWKFDVADFAACEESCAKIENDLIIDVIQADLMVMHNRMMLSEVARLVFLARFPIDHALTLVFTVT